MGLKTNDACLQKAANDEPIFVLRAQDITADILVELWAELQEEIRNMVRDGMTPEEAAGTIRRQYGLVGREGVDDPKLLEAYDLAAKMQRWPNRKVAD